MRENLGTGSSGHEVNRTGITVKAGKDGGVDFRSFVREFVRSVSLAVPVRIL